MNKITFNPDFVDNIAKLGPIQTQLIIKKEDIDGGKFITLKANNACHTIFLKMKSKVENFDFSGDEITFLDYSKFYSFYQKLKCKTAEGVAAPELEMDAGVDGIAGTLKMISKNGASFKQRLGDSDVVIKPVFNDIGLNNVAASLTLSQEEFTDLSRMCGVLNAETVSFKTIGDRIEVTAFNKINNDEYKISYPLKTNAAPVDITISGKPFVLIPADTYDINIDNDGMIEFELANHNVYDLDIYIGAED